MIIESQTILFHFYDPYITFIESETKFFIFYDRLHWSLDLRPGVDGRGRRKVNDGGRKGYSDESGRMRTLDQCGKDGFGRRTVQIP